MLTFHRRYAILNVALFALLVFIALFINDRIIRPFIGDVLVVIWIYAFFCTFLTFSRWKIALGTLLFAYSVEIAQYYNLVALLGLEHNRMARIVIGMTFDWLDLVAYSLGWGIITIYSSLLKIRDSEAD
ncbi:DUF2809 domain-containing protein [Thaumasiovibrio subtropicus]|uniref:ribosomal maturation YjgA family protein n=1 Tax=Thaumasiovibrio subtropicus TaxID=1891207 RepID=UPI000B355FAD|nr:DUF2809 domain-containing protein [Thaumasiovibrio subtropicus]